MVSATQQAVNLVRGVLVRDFDVRNSLQRIDDLENVRQADTLPAERTWLTDAPADFYEKTGQGRYPQYLIYCEEIRKERQPKFGMTTTRMTIVVEVRVSRNHLEGLTEQLQLHVDAIRSALDRHQGCIAEGYFLSGRYRVQFDRTKRGGLNYLQAARIEVELELTGQSAKG